MRAFLFSLHSLSQCSQLPGLGVASPTSSKKNNPTSSALCTLCITVSGWITSPASVISQSKDHSFFALRSWNQSFPTSEDTKSSYLPCMAQPSNASSAFLSLGICGIIIRIIAIRIFIGISSQPYQPACGPAQLSAWVCVEQLALPYG